MNRHKNFHRLAASVLTLLAGCQFASAEDFSVTQGYDAGVGTKSYNSGAGTLGLLSADARWTWYLNFTQPGVYTVSARVAVSAANAGATLQMGDYSPQHGGPGSAATAILTATDPSANVNPQWQVIGQVWVPAPGLRFIFANIPAKPTADPGLLYAIRVVGPGVITPVPYWDIARASACDISFSPGGSTRNCVYFECVPRPWPIPGIYATHTVMNGPGYLANYALWHSIWENNGVLPQPMVAFGGTRAFWSEGNGATAANEDFDVVDTARVKILNMCIPDGRGNTIVTLMGAEIGQRWHLGCRTVLYWSASPGVSGFLENPGNGGLLNLRSCAWGNVWGFGNTVSGGSYNWWPVDTTKAHLRGPSPATWPMVTGTYPYGKSRRRQDMVEMIIGGLNQIVQNDTYYNSMPATTPVLPTINVAYNIQGTDVVNQAANATSGAAYSDPTTLTNKVRDPLSSLNFSYAKVSGPSWLSVSSAGTLSGTPAAGNVGQNLCVVRATDTNNSLTGLFTMGVYVRASGGTNNAPFFQDMVTAKQTIGTLDDAKLIELKGFDPDTTNLVYSITSGNGGGQFGISGKWLVKTAPLTPGNYPLTLQVSDTNTPALSGTTNVTVTVVAGDGKGGATYEMWYNAPADSVAWFTNRNMTLLEFTNSANFARPADQIRMARDLSQRPVNKHAGGRISGYIYPPTSGSYTFYNNPDSYVTMELRLSTNASPSNMVLRASGSTVSLVGGQRYYFQALAYNGGNYSHTAKCSLEWAGPGIARQAIAAQYLSPNLYAEPKLWVGTNAFRDVLAGEYYFNDMRVKLNTLWLRDVLAYEKISGPAWLTIATDGTMTGTPGAGDVGTNLFVLRATAPGGCWDQQAFTVKVAANQVPQFTTNLIVLPAFTEGTEITGSLANYATDANVGPQLGLGDRLAFSVVSGPAWLSCEPTGELYGKPGGPHLGTNLFTVRVTDIGGLSTISQVRVVVNDAPNTPIFTVNPINFMLLSGEAINGSLASYVYDPDPGEVLTFAKLSGPAWLSVSTNGDLSGTPTDLNVGSNVFSVQVTDSTARSSVAQMVVTVTSGQFFVYEGFDATTGAGITNHTAGNGWSGNWSGTVTGAAGFTINAASVGFGTLPVTARSVSNGTNNSVTYARNMAQTIQVGGAGGYLEAWVSTIISFTDTNPGQGVEETLGSSGIAFGKQINGSLGLKIGATWFSATNSSGATTSPPSTGTYTYLCILRLLATNGNTQVTLYLDKNTAINLSNPANFAYKISQTVAGTVAFNALSLFVNKADPQDVNFDEIRIASAYAQVVPIGMTTAPLFNANPLIKPAAAAGQGYAQSLIGDITDPDVGDIHYFSKTTGPAWLVVDGSGMLTGTPSISDLGTNTFTVRVTDAAGNYAETQLKIFVAQPPGFVNDPINRIAPANLAYSGTIAGEATNATGGTLTYSKVSGPAWLSVASNGALSGTPALGDMGINTFTVSAANTNGLVTTATLLIEVPSDGVLAWENFAGTAGTSANGSAGGRGWSGAWSGDAGWLFVSPGLTFPGLVTTGFKCIVGGQDTTLTRSMAQTVTVGNGAGERPEIWVTTRLDLSSVSATGHGILLKLFNGASEVGSFGKKLNASVGFDVGGSGFQTVSGALGTWTGTQGSWLFALKLLAVDGGTEIDMYGVTDTELGGVNLNGDPVDLTDPATFDHFATFTVSNKFTFNKVGMNRHNNTNSCFDEIRVGTSYEANIGRAGSTNIVATYTLTYNAGTGGTISGTSPQVVNHGTSGSAVTAVPSYGYAFTNWSDGLTSNPRTDSNVTNDITVTANFFSLPPPVAQVLSIHMVTNRLTVDFLGTEGYSYDIERSLNLLSWTGVQTNVPAPPGGLVQYVEFPATNGAAFYRLKLR